MSKKEKRNSFVFYLSFFEAIEGIDVPNQLVTYKTLCAYALLGKSIKYKELPPIVQVFLKSIEPVLIANDFRYKNGNKGGAPKGNQNAKKPQKQPNNQRLNKKQPNEEGDVEEDVKEDVEGEGYKDTSPAFSPPTMFEVFAYADERGRSDIATRFYEYYAVGNWHDKDGRPIKNWKQKFITWERDPPSEKVLHLNAKNLPAVVPPPSASELRKETLKEFRKNHEQ